MHSNQIAAYIDRTLDEAARSEFENHLAECAECRAELVGAHRVVHAWPRGKRFLVWPLLAAAAVATFFLVGPRDTGTASSSGFRSGGATASGIQRVEAVRPVAGATIAEDDRTFIWQAVARGANYRLTLTQIDGARVWIWEATDTLAIVPDSVSLTSGTTYLWVVDAMLADGSQAKTEVRSFSIAP